ncbi:MAG: hydantoinase B/oxoprolinase family protein [Deltaproteobacteria bacterium]|nr:MAG: hydantoinase B/oxoprolinase family protein [Deltaproteobacteria bacterium]
MNPMTLPRSSARTNVDPITLEVIRHGIISICDQIDANMTRTAFSPYIYEYKDYAVGFVGVDAQLLAQCTGGMPVFVADSVGMAVRDGLETYGRENFHKGDVVVCNHAAVQGQHLNNTVMYTPVFAGANGDELIGFFAVNCHWIDIGGSAIGSVSYSSTDIFMEGLQLRSIKLWSKGEPIEEVYRIIENNTRFPLELLGDIEAQLGGCLLGRDLTQAMADKYGTVVFLGALDMILDQCAAATREKIRAIPDGVYQHEAFLDDDGVRDENIPIKVKVIVAGDEMTIDFSEISDQVKGCINSGYYGGGRTCARVAFKYLIATDEPANEGTFRPLKMILPEGKLLSAEPTAAMGLYSIPFPTVIDCIIKALEPALPQRVTGAHFGTFSSLSFSGKRTDTGAPFKANDSGHGGWGACATHDGAGPFRTMAHGDTRLIPIELQESMYPYRVEEFCLRQDSGGPGKWRGGLGFDKQYVLLAPCELWANFDRIGCPPWGVQGAKAAKAGQVLIFKDGKQEAKLLYKTENCPLQAGDRVRMATGGGGGYGSPSERPVELVQRDVIRGFVSLESARDDYGVVIEADGRASRVKD